MIWSVCFIFIFQRFLSGDLLKPASSNAGSARQDEGGHLDADLQEEIVLILTISGFLPQMSIRRISTMAEGSSIIVMETKLVVASERFCKKISQ